jgi:hypothetical protein
MKRLNVRDPFGCRVKTITNAVEPQPHNLWANMAQKKLIKYYYWILR